MLVTLALEIIPLQDSRSASFFRYFLGYSNLSSKFSEHSTPAMVQSLISTFLTSLRSILSGTIQGSSTSTSPSTNSPSDTDSGLMIVNLDLQSSCLDRRASFEFDAVIWTLCGLLTDQAIMTFITKSEPSDDMESKREGTHPDLTYSHLLQKFQ